MPHLKNNINIMIINGDIDEDNIISMNKERGAWFAVGNP